MTKGGTEKDKEFIQRIGSTEVLVEVDAELKKRVYTLTLHQGALVMTLREKRSLVQCINTNAVVGVVQDTLLSTRVHLHACINVGDDKREMRRRKTYTFTFANAEMSESFIDGVNAILGAMPGGSPTKRSVRVILNPRSGKRHAEIIYREIELLFGEAGMQVKKTVTKGPEHAKQIGYKFKLNKYDTIVFVSGDGLLHEFINGLLARDDWEEARKVRLSLIPAGTGNGIACSLGLGDPMSSALACVRGSSRPLDVSVVRQGDLKWASILSLTWGLVSDVDIESERFRSLGAFRLQIGAAIRILNLRIYKGKISYLPAIDNPKSELAKIPKCTASCDICQSSDSIEHIKNLLGTSSDTTPPSTNLSSSTTTIPSPSSSVPVSPYSTPPQSSTPGLGNSQHLDLPSSSDQSPIKDDSTTSSTVTSTTTTTTTANTNTATITPSSTIDLSSSSSSVQKIATRDIVVPLPKLPSDNKLLQDKQLGEEWRTIEGEFIGFIASTVSHLSSDFIASPAAHYSDGFIEMILIRHDPKISKLSLVSILTDAETGKHIDSPFIDHFKVRAIVLEPGKDKEGILAVDGERIPYGKTSMECIRGCINLVSKDS